MGFEVMIFIKPYEHLISFHTIEFLSFIEINFDFY